MLSFTISNRVFESYWGEEQILKYIDKGILVGIKKHYFNVELFYTLETPEVKEIIREFEKIQYEFDRQEYLEDMYMYAEE